VDLIALKAIIKTYNKIDLSGAGRSITLYLLKIHADML
jgi:hypothetical protein